ncbi:MAG: TetR/AcrR family transcriptional regulator [Leptospiraceae bacterium]|nr:TetR/AcrR family transcriptional regulator [Leptospiraceae bacterium]
MPKIVNHEEYRELLLNKAFELFARRGYEITMRELAKELEVSTGSLYHYFENKEDIFRQTMEYIAKKQVQILLEKIGKNKTPDEKVQLVLEYILQNESFFQNTLFLAIDYYRQNNCSHPDKIIQEMTHFYKQNIAEQLGITHNVLASAVLSFILGFLVHRILNPDAGDWEGQIALLRTLIGLLYTNEKTN